SGTVLLIAFILKVAGSLPPNFILGIFIFGIVIGAYLPAKSGLLMLINAGEIDMNVLMTIAVIGAIAIGEVEEGAMVVFLFSLGNTLQAFTLDKTRKSIVSLMELTPEQALVRRDNHEFTLPVDQIKVGDLVIIKPGERIPMDGRIVRGTSSVDQSSITGESIPVDKHPGDEVFAGTINQRGAMEIQVAKTAKDNTISRLIAMVEEAQSQRARSQQLVDRFAKYYTPVVIGLAVLVAVVPPVAFNQPLVKWAYQSLAMLLVACPCALVISTPVSIVSAIGNAARNGVLFKGGVYLEEMADLTVMAFDKTGTLTQGQPEVTDVLVYSDLKAEELLAVTAAIESRSEHPLGTATIQHAKRNKIDIPVVSGFDSFTGKGATGTVNDELYFVGSPRYIEEHLPVAPEVIDDLQRLQTEGKTVILLADKKEVKGIIAVADTIRPSIIQTLQDLRRVGIKRVIMLTGDNALTAKAIARQLNIDETKADLLPEDKVESVKSLLRTGKVAMIGDGVNDAPALATATVGIAMGAAGTDTALETADVALMADNLSALPYAIRLSKKTIAIIRENIALSIIIKALIMALVIPGMLTMWLAVIGDMGASLLVTLNGLRLLRVKQNP
ncbi:MAG: cadmium-translocating P-type ATPase, partial [Syntrophomonadaceae bacterium]|nr:cadmium-translocating P-type ATPase [Syntrophomonadaceae bacterium]